MINIYTDGSSRASTEDGGFGVVVLKEDNNERILLHAFQKQKEKVTNNQMELESIIYACQYADKNFSKEKVTIYSDSAYCVNSINNWMYNWAKNNWINSKKEKVKNIDMMKLLYKYFSIDFYHCQVVKISGHTDIPGNELADALATHNETKFKKIINENNIKVVLS